LKVIPALVVGSMILIGCADPPEPTDEGPPNEPATVPDVAEIVCEDDGVIRLLEPSVRAQPDGLHLRVEVSLDEPVQLDGPWLDEPFQPGATDFVTVNPPGQLTLACWPISQLDSSSFEPERAELEILDPEGIYVSEELECLPGDDTAGWTTDWVPPGPDRDPPVTLAEARAVLERLEPGDVVAYAGYPERPGEHIAVERDDRTIGIMLFHRDGDTVDSGDGGICEGEAVLPSQMVEQGDDR
jgi:hypothetical protein